MIIIIITITFIVISCSISIIIIIVTTLYCWTTVECVDSTAYHKCHIGTE